MTTHPREITNPFTLSRAEFAYLLSLVSAHTMIGADPALFPSDPAAADALQDAGRHEVETNQWLVWDAEAGHHRINEQLMQVVATVADPRVALLTEIETTQGNQGVNHYLSPALAVELAFIGDTCTFVVLDSRSTMLARLASTWRFPEQRPAEDSFTLDRETASRLRQNPDARLLERAGLPETTAFEFAASASQPLASGTITVVRAVGGEAVTMRLLGVLIGGNGLGWLAVPTGEFEVRYSLAALPDFIATLGDYVNALDTVELDTLMGA